jgi:glutamate mutase epsilon subunit
MKSDVKNELFYRALEIIQDETYLDEADFDEIKRQKRQSPDQNEGKINSETIEAFKKALNLHEIFEIQKIQNHREQRQIMMVNTTLTSLDDIINAVPEEQRQQFCDLVSAEFFGGTLRSTFQSNFSCSASSTTFPLTVPSVLSFQG